MNKIIRFWTAAILIGGFIIQGNALADGGDSVDSLPEDIQEMVDNEQFEQAIVELKDFIVDERKNADAWNLLGFSQRKTGLLDESLVSYKKALRLDRKHIGAHHYISELYLTLGDIGKAKKHLAKLMKYCGDCDQYEDLAETIDNQN